MNTINQRFLPSRATSAALLLLAACHAGGASESETRSSPDVAHSRAESRAAVTAKLYPGFDNYSRPASAVAGGARAYFEQGLQWLFGFNDDEAVRSFRRAAELDPHCAMAWWGVAYAEGININDPVMSERESRDAYDALQRALALREHATPVDRALIDALALRYAWPAPEDTKAHEQAYSDAMGRVHAAFPDDADVAVLYAESLMNLQPWNYWTRDGAPQGRATEIVAALERAIELAPRHPGALHFYIHALEASKQPERAVSAAERLLDVVPGSSHLVHMPSHIFVRVGRYADAVDSNARAVTIDRRYLQNAPEQDYYGLYIAHNLHFLTYAAMMEGRYELALDSARRLDTDVPSTFMERYPGIADGWAAALPHVLIRFGKWREILDVPEYPQSRHISRAMRRYARSIANAALGQVDQAREEIAAFEREAGATPLSWSIGMNPAHAIYPMARKMMAGELAFREGDHEAAFAHLRDAVKIEDELLYDEPPPWLQPVRHALGALLMASGRYADAEEVYQADLQRNPRNGWALLGLEQSKRMQGELEGLDDLVRQRSRAWFRADVKPTSSCYCEPGAVDLGG